MVAQAAPSVAESAARRVAPRGGGRIARLRVRYQTGPAFLSVERAKYYTESWRSTEGKAVALPVRVALAMKHVYEKMTH